MEGTLSSVAREGCRVIAVDGELDELMAAKLDAAIDECREGPVVVELSHMVFVSSAGIRALLRDRRVQVALVCPPGNVMRLFDVVRANSRVPTFDDLDAAIEGSASRSTYSALVTAERPTAARALPA
jgi:anti-anti-sigma factor